MESTKKLVEDLKNANQDFEFYPTIKEMIRCIISHHPKRNFEGAHLGNVLDIGCGTCNFKKFAKEIDRELVTDRYNTPRTLGNYYVIEKSQLLIEKLEKDVIVLGTDFNTTTLIDKPVDTIFCNPPYSDFENWTVKILKESAAKYIYLVIPQRWKKSPAIQDAIAKYVNNERYDRVKNCFVPYEPQVLGSFSFLDAERSARAKVDILLIDKSDYRNKESAWDTFFEENFPMEGNNSFNFDEINKELKNELATGKDKIEILVNGYNNALNNLLTNFKALSQMDSGLLEQIGVSKDSVKKSLQSKIENLKILYWDAALNCLDDITKRLTVESRNNLMERFKMTKSAEFTAEGIYSFLCWIIKNANDYTDKQLTEFFFHISDPKNVSMYKSNQKLFVQESYKYYCGEVDKYTLDYRIITTTSKLPYDRNNYYGFWRDDNLKQRYGARINDVCVIARTLGFAKGQIQWPEDYGKKGVVYMDDNKTVLFEFKIYMNDNVHLKFNVEFMKAFNVTVAKLLGWINSKEDIKREFTAEMAKGAEKYFDINNKLELASGALLLGLSA